jgi:hypothetical protein
MCDTPFDTSILQLSNGIRHVMPSTERKLELTAKASIAQPVSQPAVCSNGLRKYSLCILRVMWKVQLDSLKKGYFLGVPEVQLTKAAISFITSVRLYASSSKTLTGRNCVIIYVWIFTKICGHIMLLLTISRSQQTLYMNPSVFTYFVHVTALCN